MKPRVIGIETEYGAFRKSSDKTPTPIYEALKEKWLLNGGKVYIDCGSHPEYATPECSNPVDLVIYDKVGETILRNKLPEYEIFKHSVAAGTVKSNISEVSFGCHENYQVASEHYDRIIKEIIPFLVTRQIFTGAGKVRGKEYHISQRSYHINTLESSSATGEEKPMIKTHNEHLSSKKYRRLQISCGEANMSEISTYLKVGTTSLMLDLLEQGTYKPIELNDPVMTIKDISKDKEYKWMVQTSTGNTVSAIDIQRNYLEAIKQQVSKDEITDDILARWGYVLNTLETSPMKLDRWLDWVIKKKIIDAYIEKNQCNYENPKVKGIDLRYHDLNKNTGLFYALQKQGLVESLVKYKDIKNGISNPPEDTRAWFRGNFVKQFLFNKIKRLDWDRGMIELANGVYKRFY
ncbi:MAG: proteasome accessory factor PafA2 family protein, partial [Planctomycetota bacterium]|nr:proteasome accessory factor PafA2 family protein [Planctomycetota bacterium]